MKNKKTIGVLGGMGPFATLLFFETILKMTLAKKDSEHFRMIIDSNTNIPSRSRNVLYNEDSPVAGMIDSCKRLENYPVDFIVIPCNSACYFLPEIVNYINVPILNIIEITATSLAEKVKISDNVNVAVLGGAVTYRKRSYEQFLNKYNLFYTSILEKTQQKVEALIEKIKLNKSRSVIEKDFDKIIDEIDKSFVVDYIILGCTELSYLSNFNCKFKLIDSTIELAKKTIEVANGE